MGGPSLRRGGVDVQAPCSIVTDIVGRECGSSSPSAVASPSLQSTCAAPPRGGSDRTPRRSLAGGSVGPSRAVRWRGVAVGSSDRCHSLRSCWAAPSLVAGRKQPALLGVSSLHSFGVFSCSLLSIKPGMCEVRREPRNLAALHPLVPRLRACVFLSAVRSFFVFVLNTASGGFCWT